MSESENADRCGTIRGERGARGLGYTKQMCKAGPVATMIAHASSARWSGEKSSSVSTNSLLPLSLSPFKSN